jgi:electron transfer flavoprotein alpha subunit
VALDPSDHTVSELKDAIVDVDDADEIREILDAERDGKDRKTAKEAIEKRLDAVDDESTGDGAAGDEAEPTYEEPDDEDAEAAVVDEAPDEPATADKRHVRAIDGEYRDMWVYCETQQGELIDVSREMLGKARELMDTYNEQYGDLGAAVSMLEEARGLVAGGEVPDEGEGSDVDLDEVESWLTEARDAVDDLGDLDLVRERLSDVGDRVAPLDTVGLAGEYVDVALGLVEDHDDTEDENVVAVLVGDEVGDLAEEAIAYGADVAIYLEEERLERFLHEPYTEIFCDMCRGDGHPHGRADTQAHEWLDYDEPRYTVFPATNNGRDVSALVQAELDSGLASDCSDLFIQDAEISNPAKTGEPGTKKVFPRIFHMKRPDFSGFEYSTILCIDKPDREFHPQGASVIPGSFDLPEPDHDREGIVVEHEMPLDDDWFAVDVTEYDTLEGGVDLTGNDVVVALGRGIGRDTTRGIELGLDLVDQFEAADLGLSRGVITASYEFAGHVEQYVTEERQIGESGQVVEPDLYIAAGISGAVQHKVGCDESDTIVAINTDPDADIRDWSDYFIEGDLFEVLPALTEALAGGDLHVGAIADAGATDD